MAPLSSKKLFDTLVKLCILFRYGTQALSLKSFIQSIVGLLSDPSGPVRDAAVQTLVEIYKHVGKLEARLVVD